MLTQNAPVANGLSNAGSLRSTGDLIKLGWRDRPKKLGVGIHAPVEYSESV